MSTHTSEQVQMIRLINGEILMGILTIDRCHILNVHRIELQEKGIALVPLMYPYSTKGPTIENNNNVLCMVDPPKELVEHFNRINSVIKSPTANDIAAANKSKIIT